MKRGVGFEDARGWSRPRRRCRPTRCGSGRPARRAPCGGRGRRSSRRPRTSRPSRGRTRARPAGRASSSPLDRVERLVGDRLGDGVEAEHAGRSPRRSPPRPRRPWPGSIPCSTGREQTQTSPTRTSAISTLFFPSIVSVNGPPAFSSAELDQPLAVLGRGRDLLALELDGHLLAVVGRAPDRDRHARAGGPRRR